MAYPSTPVTFVEVVPGEHRSDVANLIGQELTAIETATLDPAAQTVAPVRMRQGGNQVEWGPAAVGLLSVLGSTGGKSFIGLGAEAGSVAGKYTTRAQSGIVITNDGAGGMQVWAVPAVNTPNQTPVLLFTLTKTGTPVPAVPVVGVMSTNPTLSVPNAAYTAVLMGTVNVDPYGFYIGGAAGTFKVPVGLGGCYLVLAFASWVGNATGNRLLRITHVNTGVVYPDWRFCDPGGGAFWHHGTMLRNLNDNDTFKVEVMQTSGAALGADCGVRFVKLA